MLLKCQKGNKLSIAEQSVINYINLNAEEILQLSITDIAERVSVSVSTVSRAIRKCGISKITDIRYRIAEGNLIYNDVLENAYKECNNTIRKIDVDVLSKVVEHIQTAKKIHILAAGVTTLVAREFEFRLQREGYNAILYRDEVLKSFDRIVEEDDLVIIFSVKAENENMLIAAALAKSRNATVVSCCCPKYDTALKKLSDIMISGSQAKIILNPKQDGYTYSRLGLEIIMQAIIKRLCNE